MLDSGDFFPELKLYDLIVWDCLEWMEIEKSLLFHPSEVINGIYNHNA